MIGMHSGVLVTWRHWLAAHVASRFAAVLISISASLAGSVAQDARGEEKLDAIAQVFLANRENFQSFSCKFRVIHGRASSIENAWSEKLDIRSEQYGLLAVHAGKMRYDSRCVKGEKTMAEMAAQLDKDRGRQTTSAACSSKGEFFDANLDIHVPYGSLLRVVNIHRQGTFQIVHNPLSMGIMGPGDQFSPAGWIAAAKAGKHDCSYKGTQVIDGVTTDVIECGFDASAQRQHRLVLHLDLQRGAIPLRQYGYDPDGGPESETRALDIRRTANGGWICGKSISVYPSKNGRCSVWVIALEEIRLEPPDRELFAIDLEDGWEVSNVADMRSTVRITGRERFYLDELPQWIDRCNERLGVVVKRQQALGASVEPMRHADHTWWWVGLGSGAIALLGGALLFRRYLRSA